ncbi:hypothetical protein [Gallaecimonas xiamenensis]|uniref:Uncharacterized protein n=1 Tax=Gallaecimonas xiamenensis 3-C-1 TaxID=745411 RepID=K2JN99_9GAMM|nr:hypothetical protein [Gallaecimonas xiamenensis]EKE76733.1 hypothetical protein B3C1_04030 [Gallaecimonas xiamenensis 3-C-1]
MDLRLTVAAAVTLAHGAFVAVVLEHYYSNREGYELINWRDLASRQCETQIHHKIEDAFTRSLSVWTTTVLEPDERRFVIAGTLSAENYLGEWQDAAYRCELELSYRLINPFDKSAWLAKAVETNKELGALRLTRVEIVPKPMAY